MSSEFQTRARSALASVLVLTAAAAAQPFVWSQRVRIPDPAAFHRLEFDTIRGVSTLVTQGYGADGTWTWDGVTWSQAAAWSPERLGGAMTAFDTARGVMVLFGGEGPRDGGHGGPPYVLDETWEWDGWRWMQRDVAGPALRMFPCMTYDSWRGVVVLYGGYTYSYPGNIYYTDTWEWDGQTWSLRATTGPPCSLGSAMAFDAVRGVAVLFGQAGYPWPTCNWEWDGESWHQVTAEGPIARQGPGMAFDERRGVIVLYSGQCGRHCDLEDTWEYDGVTWTQRKVYGPRPRFLPGMAYDSRRGVTVMYGGIGAPNDTWEFDGQSWRPADEPVLNEPAPIAFDESRQRSVLLHGRKTWEWDGGARWHLAESRLSGDPFGSGGGRMVYDAARHRSVLFGGYSESPTATTWGWDGTTWSALDADGPPMRVEHAMAFDRDRSVVVLFGGYATWPNVLSDTWEFVNDSWVQRVVSGPSRRYGAWLVYDTRRHVSVLIGGVAAAGYSPETWEWDGAAWTLRTSTAPDFQYSGPAYYDDALGLTLVSTPTSGLWAWDGETWRHRESAGDIHRYFGPGAYDSYRRGAVLCRQGTFVLGYPACQCDFDRNQMVDLEDLAILLMNFGAADEVEPTEGDADGDADVDLADLARLLSAFGQPCE